MKNPAKTPITRASLLSTASYNTRWFASLIAGTAVLGATAHATNWEGDVSSDWNDNQNWAGNAGNTGNATVNTVGGGNPPFTATISADATQPVVDIFIGSGVGVSGRLDHSAGAASTGSQNWMYVGHNGGIGVYNLANTGATGGTFTGFGQGTGSMTVGAGGPGGRLYVGGFAGSGSNGTVNVNTQGTLTVRTQFQVGTNASTGVFNLDNGTVNAGTAGQDSWVEIGNGRNCNGTFNMSGGVFNKLGNQHMIIGANGATGVANISGGTLNVNNEFWVANGQTGGDPNIGSTGTLNFSGGTINVGSWVAIGRGSGLANGTVNMTGGTWNKTGNNQFIVGANSPATMTMSAGLVDVQQGFTWIGETATATPSVLTISGSAEFRTSTMSVGQSAPDATLNLDGGTLRTQRFIGTREANDTGASGGVGTINFNGTQIIATAQNTTNFISTTVDNAIIGTGNLLINSNGFNLAAPKSLTGTGGVVKTGDGVLTLLGFNDYQGDNVVNGGGLVLSADQPGFGDSPGDITLADGTSLGVTAVFAGDQLAPGDVTMGANTVLNLNLGDLNGLNPANSLLDVNGTLTLNGTVQVNVTGEKFEVGDLPLVSYDATQTGGAGALQLVNLPNGVVATLQNDPNYFGPDQGLYYLDITGVALPRWNGDQADANWTTANNWIDQVSNLPSTYADPDPVLFNDDAAGSTDVVLNATVNPSAVTFANEFLPYTLSGTGSISGSGSLTKSGLGTLAISTDNDYTGVTTLAGGTTTVATLTDGGVSGPLGAASADPANLVLAGGTLEYTGAATTFTRGLTITGPSGLIHAEDLTLSGQILRTGGGITKTGAGDLTLTNASNSLGALRVNEGDLVFDGSGGAQTNVSTALLLGAGVNVTLTNDTTLTTGDVNVGDVGGATSTLSLTGNAQLTTNNRVMTGMNAANADGVIMISGDAVFNRTGGWLSVGTAGTGTLTVMDNGVFNNPAGDFNISDLDNSTGTMNLQDNGVITAAVTFWGKGAGATGNINISGGTYTGSGDFWVASAAGSFATVTQTGGVVNSNGGTIQIGRNGLAEWNQSGGTVNAAGWAILGRDGEGDGTLNVSGGVFNQTQLDRPLMVGEFGIGELNITAAGEVNSLGANGLILANEPSGTGTVNLDGGILTVRRVREGNDGNGGVGGSSTFNFDGGVLRAGANANMNFMSGLDFAVIEAGGAFIDTNGQTVSIAQPLEDGGGDLTKQGAGTLLLDGANSYFGTTTVTAGALGGSGSIAGALDVDPGGTIAPGAGVGTFTVGDSATIGGTYVAEIDGADADRLTVFGALTIEAGAVLDVDVLNAPTQPVYIIASYTSLSGSFTQELDLPGNYVVDYNYEGGNQIALVGTPSVSPYDTWAAGFGLDPETDGARDFDADDSGQVNLVEFALGGDPGDGADNAKIYSLTEDSDADTQDELLMTIAVRTGTPAFSGGPSPTATHEGVVYTIEGSLTLSGFPEAVTPVSPAVTTGLPAAPAGYEYRTFRLDGSNGLPSLGFLRVDVSEETP